MRPRKVIGLYCSDAIERSALAFSIETRGYRVVQGGTLADFAAAVQVRTPDCFLVVHLAPYPSAAVSIGAWISGNYLETPLVAVVPGKYILDGYLATCQVRARDGMVLILEALRIACARKRGPKGPRSQKVTEHEEALCQTR